jgi:flagellar protein FliL
MSAAIAPTAEGAGAAPAKGKKKLIVILAAVLLLALAGGAAAVFMMKKRAAEAAAAAEADGEDDAAPHAKGKGETRHDAAHPPTFLPLEAFVVNLADKDADRYAQIGITLEVEDPKFADQLKAYMPAIRNGILMVLAHKTSQQLLERAGKEALAREIMRESVRPLGIEVAEPDDEEEASSDDAHDKPDAKAKAKKKKRKKVTEENPVKHVHFSNFIIQ